MNESEALSQHSVHVRCLRSDLILAAWLGRASLSDRLYPPPAVAHQCSFPLLISLFAAFTRMTPTRGFGRTKHPLKRLQRLYRYVSRQP